MDTVSNNSITKIRPDTVVFITQILLLFVVVITSLVNLTMEWGNTNLWTMILTGCLGYMLPNPRLKRQKYKDCEIKDGVVLRDVALERDKSAS